MPHILLTKNSQLHYLPFFSWEKKLDEPMSDYAWEIKIKKNPNDSPPSCS